MRIILKKEEFTKIETAFETLNENIKIETPIKTIEESLHNCFPDHSFYVNIIQIPITDPSPLFVMSIFPERSVLDKIVENVLNNKSESELASIWKGNRKWVIEIDSRFIENNKFTYKEMTAALLHEIGHIAMTDTIPNKLVTIMQYELAKTETYLKVMSKHRIFRPLFSLPILELCVLDKRKSFTSIHDEIKADKFVKSMGYQNDLVSCLKKIIKIKEEEKSYAYGKYNDISEISAMTRNVLMNVEDLRKRHYNLSKLNMLKIKESCVSPYITGVIDDYIEKVFESADDGENLRYGRKTDLFLEQIDKNISNYYMEFFEIGKKKLKRIDPADIDYIQLKINDIQNQSDKIMLITYIYSKLDIVNYYLDIINDSIMSKQYQVPHTEKELENMKIRLNNLYNDVMSYKIPMKNRNLVIAWPDGYEG